MVKAIEERDGGGESALGLNAKSNQKFSQNNTCVYAH